MNTAPTPPPAAPATTALVIEQLQYIAESPPREVGGFHPNAVKAAKDAITHLASLQARCARLEEDKARAIGNTCEAIRAELKRVSAGEVHTWGFVAAFMDIINRTEKEMLK